MLTFYSHQKDCLLLFMTVYNDGKLPQATLSLENVFERETSVIVELNTEMIDARRLFIHVSTKRLLLLLRRVYCRRLEFVVWIR